MTLGRSLPLVALLFVAGVRPAEAQCTATVTPTSVSVPSIGSTSSISVVTGTFCSWTATSSVPWITINSATGSGIGQVNYTVLANTTGVTRTGTLTVAGQTVTFTQAVSSCVYNVTPTSVSVPSIGSTSALSVTTGTSCSWTAASSVTWITITSGASGTGMLPVNYSVAANTTGATRTGTIVAAGITVTFTQAASSCVYTVTPTAITAPLSGNVYAVTVSTGTSCSWTATSAASWITITSGSSGTGIAPVNISVDPTTTGRLGTLTVAGQTVTITQGTPAPPPAPPTNVLIIR